MNPHASRQRQKSRQQALATFGTPVPGTGHFSWRRFRGKRLRPYMRPRAGGGVKGRNSVAWGPRAQS